MTERSKVTPVFLKQKDIPDASNKRPSVLEICLAAERISGQGTIVGAQEIRGLWRLYPATLEGRAELLTKGMCLRNVSLQVHGINPFLLRDDSGVEKPSTKVWVDDLPISVADSEIEFALSKQGCELRSGIKLERARDSDNKLTRFLTGRRFLFVTVPSTPLPKTLKINIFTARIYHREQKLAQKIPICSNCLESGHHKTECKKEVVCRDCQKSGHKRADPQCEMISKLPPPQTEKSQDKVNLSNQPKPSSTPKPDQTAKTGSPKNRGRTNTRQPSLSQSLHLAAQRIRSRSETPKRRRSDERVSPLAGSAKQGRLSTVSVMEDRAINNAVNDAEDIIEMENNVPASVWE